MALETLLETPQKHEHQRTAGHLSLVTRNANPRPNSPSLMSSPRRPQTTDPDQVVLAEKKVRARPPRMFRVVIHNDDYTTMEFVVFVLQSIFSKTETEAVRLMLAVHNDGSAVAGVYPRSIAETKVAESQAAAEQHGMPLLVTSEPESDDDPAE